MNAASLNLYEQFGEVSPKRLGAVGSEVVVEEEEVADGDFPMTNRTEDR